MPIDPDDGGYGSRKLHMAYIVMALQVAAYLACSKWVVLAPLFPQLCMGLIGAAGVYAGGNMAVKWIAGKFNGSATASGPPSECPPPPDEMPGPGPK